MAAAGTPVIIVPGFMGSELWVVGGTDAAINRIYLNPVALAVRWPWLQLGADGVSPLPGNKGLGARTILYSFYAPLVDQLLERGWEVDGAWYDWRRQLSTCALQVVDRVLAQDPDIPCHLVCHSMGGLVARLALQLLASAGKLWRVGRVVGLAVPHWGSWEAGGGLSCKAWPTEDVLSLLVSLGVLAPGRLSLPFLQPMACSWPSLYQLLPSPFAPGMTLQQALALYFEETWHDSSVPTVDAWMAEAFNAWQTFPPLPTGVPWLSLAGVGYSTANGPNALGICDDPSQCPQTMQGDGTVPLQYAHYGSEPTLTLPLDHNVIAQDYRAVAAVDTWLRGGTPAGAAPIPGEPQSTGVIPRDLIQAEMRRRASSRAQSASMPSSALRGRPRTYIS